MNDKSKARVIRIEDSLLRIEALRLLRLMLLESFSDKKTAELYIVAYPNESINELKSKARDYINYEE